MLRARPLVVILALLSSTPALAAGYFVSEVGPKAIGRGGAFVVNPDDPTAMWINPAGLSNIQGLQFFGDVSAVRLQSRFTRSCDPSCAPTPYSRQYGGDSVVVNRHPFESSDVEGGGFFNGPDPALGTKDNPSVGSVENQHPARLVPFAGLAMNGELIGLPGLGLGFAAYGPNTGGVRYARNGLQRYSAVESEPLEALFEAAASYRFNRYLTLGLGVAMVSLGTRQRLALSLDKEGRESRQRDADVDFTVRQDFIPTFIAGFNSNPIAGLEIGGSFIPARRADRARGPFKVGFADQQAYNADEQNIPVEFNDDKAQAIVRMGSPPVARAGIRYHFKPWFDVEVAVVREFWSFFRYVRLDVVGLDARAQGQALALPPTIQPKEYRDTWAIRTGGDLNVVPGIFAIRAGAFAEESAIPEETLDVGVADGRKLGLSSGMTLGYFGFRLTWAWQHIFIEPRTVKRSLNVSNNPIPPTFGGGQTAVSLGSYAMAHDLFSVGITMDVGEVALRVKGALTGDKGWWKPEGVQDRKLVDAGNWLQKQSNF